MVTDCCVIESLEGRQFLSASPLLFEGAALNSAGTVEDKLAMCVRRTSSGFTDEIIVIGSGNQLTTEKFNMTASGEFTGTIAGTDLTLTGKMNAAKTEITGEWKMKGVLSAASGKFALDVVPPATSNVPTAGQVASYSGTETNGRGQTGNTVVDVYNYRGVLNGMFQVHNNDDQLVPMVFNINSSGDFSFSFSFADQSDIIQGKLSDHGKILSATMISINTGGTNSVGSVTATQT